MKPGASHSPTHRRDGDQSTKAGAASARRPALALQTGVRELRLRDLVGFGGGVYLDVEVVAAHEDAEEREVDVIPQCHGDPSSGDVDPCRVQRRRAWVLAERPHRESAVAGILTLTATRAMSPRATPTESTSTATSPAGTP